LAADEHHADWCGEKGYVAFTAGEGCILGLALTPSADEAHLRAAYGQFAQEARAVKLDYAPQTVNTDGWFPTRNAFRSLFATITPILCFLHGFLKIRERGRQVRPLHDRVWDVYRAATAGEFRQRMATFRAWCRGQNWPKSVLEMAAKLWNREAEYAEAYSHPGCHRTSNMVDRLMNRLTRFLYAGPAAFTGTGFRASDVCAAGHCCTTSARSPPAAAKPARTRVPHIVLATSNITGTGSITFKSVRPSPAA
jgi:hypothetical protein